MQISHILSIGGNCLDANRPENAKDICMSNCLEYQAKIALSKI